MAQSVLVPSKNIKFAITDSEVPKNNHLGRLDLDGIKYPHLVDPAKFLKQSCIAYALTVDPKPSKTLLQQFWFTAEESTITNKKGDQVPDIFFCTDLSKGMMTAFSLRKALRFSDKPKSGFEALPTDAELIQFLDDMEYCWDNKPRSTIPNKKLTLIKKANMPSQLNFIFSHFIQCMSGKSGSLDQASKFLYANAYPTTADCSFAKVGQRSLEVKPLANEVSISTLCSRLSLYTSSTSAATKEVLSSANPAATTGSKRPSASSFGPSKKAKVTKEKPATSSRPEEVSRQTSLDDFVVLSSTTAAITSIVPATSVAVTTTVTQPEISVLQSTEDSLTTAVNETTSAVVTAGEELKTLTATCSTKAEASQLSALQADIVKQVLTKLNAPAMTHSPSFISDDRTQLNIAVEFNHQTTLDLPVIEGRLDSLEAEVRKLASAQPSSPIKDLSLAYNDKEREKAAEEIKEGETIAEADAEVQLEDPPSLVEGEKVADQAPPSFKDFVEEEEEEEEDEDEEDLDLEDQEEEQPH
ncbi:hypothetical protein L6452_26217 [Arctium lappa]|uniref:Uncharacterized protein n=1 Tax=Arctium lappa TaxID=4217 RepID=A0ACB9ADJ8_ARCLA|nr:hypothetical protein L6452_26217 [Arctium lappa]